MTFRKFILIASSGLFWLRHGKSHFASVPVISGPWPRLYKAGTLRLGKRCSLRGGRSRPSLCVFGGATLEIGDHAFINDGVNICASQSIRIGANAKIGDMVNIYDSDFHPVSPGAAVRKAPVTLGNNVWIGANVTILAGSTIGDHAVIGAGSVVTGHIPAQSLAAGNPAKVIRLFDAPDSWVRP